MENRKEELRVEVELDEMHIPEKLNWFSSDGEAARSAKAILFSIWDEKDKSTYKIDLWTKEMTVDEMKMFFHQTFLTLADTLARSTGEVKMSESLKDFAAWYAEEMKLELPGTN